MWEGLSLKTAKDLRYDKLLRRRIITFGLLVGLLAFRLDALESENSVAELDEALAEVEDQEVSQILILQLDDVMMDNADDDEDDDEEDDVALAEDDDEDSLGEF